MNPNHELTMCGCRCDLCKAYTPNVQKNDQRKELAAMWHKYYGLDPSVMDPCDGCRKNPADENCPVRKCVLEKGLNHCGDCGEFPCGVFGRRCGSFPEKKKKAFDMDEYNEYILAYDNETRLKEYRLKRASEATMRFLRGRYVLDEVSDAKDEVSFRDGEQTILTIYIRDGYYDFQIGDSIVRVSDMASLEEAKRLVLARKEPNRKPFPKEQAVLSKCGQRCDLCIHYTGISEEFRQELHPRLTRVYGGDYWGMRCPGCHNKPEGELCDQMKCAAGKGLAQCLDCGDYGNTCVPQVGGPCGIEAKSMLAEDVTWAILPYAYNEYGY